MEVFTGERRLDQAAVDELSGSFRGELVWPEDSAYDEHRRAWNGSIDRFAALIARSAGVKRPVEAPANATQEWLVPPRYPSSEG